MYETFDHTADVGLRIKAANLDELFAEAARGFFSLIVVNLDEVRPVETVHYEIEGDAYDYLLFDWLNELLGTFECDRMVLCRFAVDVGPEGLKAEARGEPLDPERHLLEHEIKAITYHGLKVERQDDGWLAEVIVDI